MNKSGILVEFENYITIAIIAYIGEMFFRAIAYEGLYTLKLHPKTKYTKELCNN